MIFSVTNQKIYNYVGKTGKPIYAYFDDQYRSFIGFSDADTDFGLLLDIDFIFRVGRSFSGDQGFKVLNDF